MRKLRTVCLLGPVRSRAAGLLPGSSAPAAVQSAAAAPAGPTSATVTITAARLLDVETGHFLDRPLLRIDGGTVTAVRQRQPGEPVTFDLGDQTPRPGLIDCHTHLVGGVTSPGTGPTAAAGCGAGAR